MATEYIVTDRTTAGNVSIQIEDGQLKFVDTLDAASAEPIFLDISQAVYWKLFISDNQIAWEETVTVANNDVTIQDGTTATDYRLYVGDGQLFISTDLTHPADRSFVPRLLLMGVG